MKKIFFVIISTLFFTQSAFAGKGYTTDTQPATCVDGDFWIDTNGTTGERFYVCEEGAWVKSVGYGTSANPSFNSVHASGGNLAAANAQVTKKWITGLPYTANVTSVIYGGKHYICTSSHTADSTTEPGVGASWATVWSEVTGGGVSAWSDIQALLTGTGTYVKADGTTGDPTGTITTGDGVAAAMANALDGSGGLASKAALDALPNIIFGTGITVAEDTPSAGTDTVSITANTYQAYDANMIAWPSTVSAIEVGYLNGLTEALSTSLSGKQETLVSGTNIKTVNNTSLLGSGDIAITGGTGGYVALSDAPYSDVACTTGTYGYYGSTAYLCTGGFWTSKWTLTTHSNASPATYTLTIDGTGWNGTDSISVGGSTYIADGTKTGLSGATLITVTPDAGRTATCSGTGIAGSSSPYSADMSVDRSIACTFVNVGGGASVSDTFDGTGALSASWTVDGFYPAARISDKVGTNQSDGPAVALYTGTTFSGAQEACVYFDTSSGDNSGGPVVLGSNADNFYGLSMQSNSSTWDNTLVKRVGGSSYAMATYPDALPGETWCLSVSAGTFTVKKNGVTQTPVTGTETDTAITTGSPGIRVVGTGIRLDTFTARDL